MPIETRIHVHTDTNTRLLANHGTYILKHISNYPNDTGIRLWVSYDINKPLHQDHGPHGTTTCHAEVIIETPHHTPGEPATMHYPAIHSAMIQGYGKYLQHHNIGWTWNHPDFNGTNEAWENAYSAAPLSIKNTMWLSRHLPVAIANNATTNEM